MVRLTGNSVVRLTDRLNMTIVVDWDVIQQIKQFDKSYILSIHILRIIILVCVINGHMLQF